MRYLMNLRVDVRRSGVDTAHGQRQLSFFQDTSLSDSRALLEDRKNIELLQLLLQNPRALIRDLARRVGMSNPQP